MKSTDHKKTKPDPLKIPAFTAAAIAPRPAARSWKIMLPVWCVLLFLIWLGLHYAIDAKAIAAAVIAFGIVSSAFTWFLMWQSERGPIFWTGKLMLIYQLVRRIYETHPPSYLHRRVQA